MESLIFLASLNCLSRLFVRACCGMGCCGLLPCPVSPPGLFLWSFDLVVKHTDMLTIPSSPCVVSTGKLQNLSEISWFAWVFWLVLDCWLVLCCLMAHHHWKNASSLICHSYEAFTYLFHQNIIIPLRSANKNSFVVLRKIKNRRLSGIKRESQWQQQWLNVDLVTCWPCHHSWDKPFYPA